MIKKVAITIFALASVCAMASAQKYKYVDKTIAVVGNEAVLISDIEGAVKDRSAQGLSSDRNVRCEVLESILESKIFLMQARIDSLTVNQDMVEGSLSQQADRMLTYLGGEDKVEEYFGKPLYRLRQEWRKQYEDMSLTQQAQQDMAVREKLLDLRERIINGEKFSTLARIYSEDPGSARKGGELGMASKSIFWPVFSDAAMALKPGVISQIVETPDGFHIIEVIEKKGDMFNARHILMKPKYTDEDREKAFKTLDSLRTEINNNAVTFQMAANFYSQDPATKTNGGQMSDPNTGSAYFEIDQLKPEDYMAIKDLKEGEISGPVESTDNDGRQDQVKDYVVGKTIYKIIKVDRIIPAHTASFDEDFSQIQEQVRLDKQMRAIDDFLAGKIKETHIIIDPMFRDCEFRRSGWASKFAED